MQFTKKSISDNLNQMVYLYKRQRWMADLSRYFHNYENVPIDRPIFLLGTQGGGLTLVSRMLRRNPAVVSTTGNSGYWAGADEMYNIFWPILPPTLTGAKYRMPDHPDFPSPRGWTYATDELLPLYRNTADDVREDDKKKFQHILRWTIQRNARDPHTARFIDKSQLFTVKLSYLDRLLDGHHPKFVLIVRNPYALCVRSAQKVKSLRVLSPPFTFRDRVEFAAQHWNNSIHCALEDSDKVESFMTVRFEDILTHPEESLKNICAFLELPFEEDMLPQPEHTIPYGSMRRARWYPLRPTLNEKYLNELSPEHAEIIEQTCGEYAAEFGYYSPLRTVVQV